MYSSFFLELIKLAYDEEDADRVLQVAKKYSLPKAAVKMKGGKYFPAAMLLSPGGANKQNLRILSKLPRYFIGTGPNLNKKLLKDIPEESGVKAFRDIAVPDSQKKMLHSIVKGHELDEIQAGKNPGSAVRYRGHQSPDVILREHNRLTTLPNGFGGVKDYVKAMRGKAGPESNDLSYFGINYGESPRLSRHARKRITESISNKIRDQDIKNRQVAKEMFEHHRREMDRKEEAIRRLEQHRDEIRKASLRFPHSRPTIAIGNKLRPRSIGPSMDVPGSIKRINQPTGILDRIKMGLGAIPKMR